MSETAARLAASLEQAPYDWLVLGSAPHVGYATGYRSVAGDLFSSHRMVALVSTGRTVLVGGASDGAAALDSGIAPGDYVPFGTFYFESVDGNAPESRFAGVHETLDDAVVEAVSMARLSGRVGLDAGAADLTPLLAGQGADPVDADDWMYDLRSVKLPGEIGRLHAAARLAERGIDAAVEAAGVGATEIELGSIVAATMAKGGGAPRFTVVTSGPRSALSDARPTDRELEPGDLLRFDVGCTYEGYWSDVGRTAVVGEPDAVQASRYRAILAGEEAQLRAARAGIPAHRLFDIAVSEVEAAGLAPYRRHHCGHAIGAEVYERPVIAPGQSTVLEPGMVFCVETPFYEIGWGGMMVEDAIVITSDGAEVLTESDRSLRVVEA